MIRIPPYKCLDTLYGKTLGVKYRREFFLSEIDRNDSSCVVIIDPRISTITPSFFLGMFYESIRYLGIEAFQKKYQFSSDDPSILEDIKEGLEWCLGELQL